MANRKEIGKTPTLKTSQSNPTQLETRPKSNTKQAQHFSLSPFPLGPLHSPTPLVPRSAQARGRKPAAARASFSQLGRVPLALSLPRLFPLGPSLMRRPTASNLPHAARSRLLPPARTQPSPTNRAHPVSSFLPTRATTGPILAVVLAGFPTRARTPRLAAAL